jgi:hypothetical protein
MKMKKEGSLRRILRSSISPTVILSEIISRHLDICLEYMEEKYNN